MSALGGPAKNRRGESDRGCCSAVSWSAMLRKWTRPIRRSAGAKGSFLFHRPIFGWTAVADGYSRQFHLILPLWGGGVLPISRVTFRRRRIILSRGIIISRRSRDWCYIRRLLASPFLFYFVLFYKKKVTEEKVSVEFRFFTGRSIRENGGGWNSTCAICFIVNSWMHESTQAFETFSSLSGEGGISRACLTRRSKIRLRRGGGGHASKG